MLHSVLVTQPKPPTPDPALDAIENAPLDDRPLTKEERAAIEESRRKGRFITTDALRARLAERAKRP